MHGHAETEEFDFDNELEQEEMEHGFHFTQYSMSNAFAVDPTKRNEQYCMGNKDIPGDALTNHGYYWTINPLSIFSGTPTS